MDSGEDAEKVGVVDVHMKSYMKRGKKRFSWEADMRFVDTKISRKMDNCLKG